MWMIHVGFMCRQSLMTYFHVNPNYEAGSLSFSAYVDVEKCVDVVRALINYRVTVLCK